MTVKKNKFLKRTGDIVKKKTQIRLRKSQREGLHSLPKGKETPVDACCAKEEGGSYPARGEKSKWQIINH